MVRRLGVATITTMKKEDLWKIYCSKNPKFEDDDAQITFTGRGLKKLFEQTYDAAHTQGVANGKALVALQKPKSTGDGAVKDMMRRMGL